jgi:rSAM/selenodomain-associated transferase 2
MTVQISIVIPVLNEAEQLSDKLMALQHLRDRCQLILVDGGSTDNSRLMAEPWVDKFVSSSPGRAIQMNTGAAKADADLLLFLHIDTQLPDDAIELMINAVNTDYLWGRFDVVFDTTQVMFKVIAFFMNHRSRLTGIATGDQCLFMTRQAFQLVGGFPPIALMEDVAISAKLKKLGKPACLKAKVITSARRWQQHGIFRTILLMWRLRLAYFFGADPNNLATRYYRRS